MRFLRHKTLVVVLLATLAAAGGFFLSPWGETIAPKISITGEPSFIGERKEIGLNITDSNSGLARVELSLIQDGVRYTTLSREFAKNGEDKKFHALVVINPVTGGIRAGKATLEIVASDRSFWQNKATITTEVICDFTPPRLSIKSYTAASPGGTSVVAYEASKVLARTHIVIQNQTYRAFRVRGNDTYFAFWTTPVTDDARVKATIVAADVAGNEVQVSLPPHHRQRKSRSDVLELPAAALEKAKEFANRYPQLRGKSAEEIFMAINGEIRAASDERIRKACEVSVSQRLWEGAFLRMRGAATRANFADRRTYFSRGRALGKSVHLGVDLASTANAPIEAANTGIVVFAEDTGIYGNTIIIDHGLGLFSLYAHLHNVATTKGSLVKKGDVIGASGATGLAVGDHLHFSILLSGTFIDPTEWWDAKWVRDNVEVWLR